MPSVTKGVNVPQSTWFVQTFMNWEVQGSQESSTSASFHLAEGKGAEVQPVLFKRKIYDVVRGTLYTQVFEVNIA